MKYFRLIIVVAFGACLIGQTSLASTAYVTDVCEITLRTGPSNKHRVTSMPRSGQAVEVLESQGEWKRVRLLGQRQGSREGWVLSRYLITRQPWKNQARSLQQENGLLKEKFSRIEKQWKDAASREQGSAVELKKNILSLNKLQNEYKALKRGSASYLKLREDHEATLATLEASQRDADTLSKENYRLQTSQRNYWFGMGALVLICGLAIGYAMGKREKKRRSTLIYE